jgi:hypothetical protein
MYRTPGFGVKSISLDALTGGPGVGWNMERRTSPILRIAWSSY